MAYNPIETGTAVITNIVNPSEKIFIRGASVPIKYTIEKPTINGNVITVIMLTIAVYDIDSAVSPFASLVIIFDVTPPGQQARIIIPTAISFDNPKNNMIKNATKGRIVGELGKTRKSLGHLGKNSAKLGTRWEKLGEAWNTLGNRAEKFSFLKVFSNDGTYFLSSILIFRNKY